jgi:DNA helicase IV
VSIDELASEQAFVSRLYARLDELRARADTSLRGVRLTPATGTHANRSERDSFASLHENRLQQLLAVEDRLCFGRLDLLDGEARYVGRIGLSDDSQTQLLVDWRAPAAETFYQATAADPRGVVRRRHLTTRGRTVTGVEDEVLDMDGIDGITGLSGEGALLAALNASRTGRMRDIVATIQLEQDRVIRAPLDGVLVVQGGPGTGKTAVALHRAAYLLYTHRDRIADRGVLIVGPNRAFLRYIEQVLPSLGETGVVMASAGELYPGVTALHEDEPAVARIKGDRRMADVIAAAVRARQRPPAADVRIDIDGSYVTLRRSAVEGAIGRAQRNRKPHNVARTSFVKDVLNDLAQQLARAHRVELDQDNRDELIAELRDSAAVRRAVNLCWMPTSPFALLAGLFADAGKLAAAAPHLRAADRELLLRPAGSEWTISDVPLLDEAAELLGDDPSGARAARAVAEAERAAEIEYARGVLANTVTDIRVEAEDLVDRYASGGSSAPLSERASADRSWAFGHVVVDEAQELSAMAWRVLMRRCPSRSMTIVGDIAQTSSSAGARSWREMLDPYVAGRWRMSELTINYRTPRQIMDIAAGVLRAGGVDVRAPESPRVGDWEPTASVIAAGDTSAIVDAVRRELELLGEGSLAVLVPRADRVAVWDALRVALPAGLLANADDDIDRPVSVLSVREAKGLEFDSVVLVEPARILAESSTGLADVYVALTRPTQRLRVLTSGALPPALAPIRALGDW